MGKVLISFLGTGKLEEIGNLREYKVAKYKIGDSFYEKPFMADALSEHFKVDRIILIGTVKSMWEAVYASFYEKKHGRSILDDEQAYGYYNEIAECCSTANHESGLCLPHQQEIEEVLGGGSKIVLIKYGLSEGELNENIASILAIEQFLQQNEEIIVDITHSFRSLPMLLMNTLIYLHNVSKKRVTISSIFYGMLDTTREFDYTPVVDMKKVLEVNEWISGAYSFIEFGNAYKIAKLLEANGDKANAKVLSTFSDIKNLNHITALESQITRLNSVNSLPPLAELTVKPVINDFVKTMEAGNCKRKHSRFQYNLAKWHASKHNYSSAYLSLTEAIITHVCEEEGMDYSDKDERDEAKDILFKKKGYHGIKRIYDKVNRQRKAIAHAQDFKLNADAIIRTLKDGLEQLRDIMFYDKKTF